MLQFKSLLHVKYKRSKFMTHWEWTESLSVGIEEIDKQHKQMIDYINELQMAFTYNKMYMIEEVLNKLIDYTKSHFSYEEELLEKSGYTLLEEHKKIHSSFVKRIEFFKERYENGENVAKQLRNDLQLWTIHHIQHDDANYKPCVHKMLDT